LQLAGWWLSNSIVAGRWRAPHRKAQITFVKIAEADTPALCGYAWQTLATTRGAFRIGSVTDRSSTPRATRN